MKIVMAAKQGRLDLVKTVHEQGDPYPVQKLLQKVVQDYHRIPKHSGHVALVEYLVAAGAQPCWQMVCEATQSGYIGLARALLAHGAVQNIFGNAALGQVNDVKAMLARDPGASYQEDDGGVTALHYACASALGKQDPQMARALVTVVQLLLAAGAMADLAVHYRGLDHVTPLVCACWTGGNADVVHSLLDRGATLSPMVFWAALGHYQRHGDGHYAIAELLLDAGVNVNHNDGRTILHAFAAHEDVIGVRWLLAHGADVSARATDGATPLHAAAARNVGTKVIAELLAHGADPRAVDDAGRTSSDLAVARGQRKIARCLGLADRPSRDSVQ